MKVKYWLPLTLALAAALTGRQPAFAQSRNHLVRTPEIRNIWRPAEKSGRWYIHEVAPDGHTLLVSVIGGSGGEFLLWDVDTSQPQKKLDSTPGQGIAGTLFAFSPDGRFLAGLRTDNPVLLLWDVPTGKLLYAQPEKSRGFWWAALAWSQDSRTLLTGDSSGEQIGGAVRQVAVWDVSPSGECVMRRTLQLKEGESAPMAVAISPDNTSIAAGTQNGKFVLWDAASGELVRMWDNPVKFPETRPQGLGFQQQLLFSPDGSTLLTRSERYYPEKQPGDVRLWDVASGAQKLLLSKEASGSMAFSPDGKLLADSSVRVWDASTGKLLGGAVPPLPSTGSLYWLEEETFSTIMHSWRTGSGLVRWDVGKLKRLDGRITPRATLGVPDAQLITADAPGPPGSMFRVLSVPLRDSNGKTTAAREWQVQKVAQGSKPAVIGILPSELMGGHYSFEGFYAVAPPEGKLVALATNESGAGILHDAGYIGVIRLWDVTARRLVRVLRVPVAVWSINFSNDGSFLVAAGADNQARLWDVATGKLLRRWQTGGRGLAFAPDGKVLALPAPSPASTVAPHSINLWDIRSGKLVGTLKGFPNSLGTGINALAFAPGRSRGAGSTLAAGDGVVTRLWDLGTGRLRRAFQLQGDSASPIGFSSTGDVLFIHSHNPDAFYRWSMSWMQQPFRDMSTRTLAFAEVLPLDPERKLRFNLSFSRGGSTLTVVSKSVARVWDVKTGKLKETRRPPASTLVAPAGKAMIAPDKKNVLVRETPAAVPRAMSSVGDAWFITAAISRDGKIVAGANAYGFAHLWDARSGELLQTLMGHTGGVTALAFTPDGSTLATGSEDYTIRLWDVATGKLLKVLEGHGGAVTALAFSPGHPFGAGNTLASIADDGTVKLWRMR